jgi:hypothetical protein
MRIDPHRDRHIGVAQVFRDFADWPLEQNQHARVSAIRSRLEARIDGNEPDRVSTGRDRRSSSKGAGLVAKKWR